MVYRTTLFIVTFLLGLNDCAAQFGVAGKNKKATTFEDLNEEATEMYAGANVDALGNMGGMQEMLGQLGDINTGDWSKLLEEMMSDPESMKMMEEMSKGMGEVAEKLSETSPEELIKNALEMIESGSLFDGLKDNMDDVIANLAQTGMVPPEKLEEYKNHPEKFQEDMNGAMKHMGEMFKDPETIQAASQVLQGFSEAYKNPEMMKEQFNKFAASFSENLNEELNSDAKIEEARLQLLENPDLAGDPSLASVFSSDEMKDILNDPVKWRESVKKGQGLLSQATA